MKNESVKKSLVKSKNVLEEMRKMANQKICIKKTNTFTIIGTNFVREQLKNQEIWSQSLPVADFPKIRGRVRFQ